MDVSVAARSLSFNNIQQVQFCKMLILQGLQEVETVVPNQILRLFEVR